MRIAIAGAGNVGRAIARELLDNAQLNNCQVLVAATGDDKVNLVASLLGKTEYGVPRVVARINHPKNEWLFDQSKEAFRRLGSDFKGRTILGVGFDRDTLLEAGIDGADAFAAVSNGDNSNILAARVARENYGVTNVVARIYDPGRAEIYQRLGIPTVATVIWASDQILRRILPGGARSEWTSKLVRPSDL